MYLWDNQVDNGIKTLEGETITSVETSDDKIKFHLASGETVVMYHEQDCCENVYVEDIDGDIQRLAGQAVLLAEERTNSDNPLDTWDESHTWTFYTIRTNLDTVTIRWYGTSNGYYSEEVSIARYKDGAE